MRAVGRRVAVSHETEYGLDVSSTPRFTPSSRNCTPTSVPLPAVAVAETSTVAETLDPVAGAVRLTVDGAAAVAVRNDVAYTSKFDPLVCVHASPA